MSSCALSARAKIAGAAIDMSPAGTEAIATNLRDTAIVFDRFHIVKLLNDKLSDLRRDLYREACVAAQSSAGDGLLPER